MHWHETIVQVFGRVLHQDLFPENAGIAGGDPIRPAVHANKDTGLSDNLSDFPDVRAELFLRKAP